MELRKNLVTKRDTIVVWSGEPGPALKFVLELRLCEQTDRLACLDAVEGVFATRIW
jgi:hypothetical protein